MENSTALYAWYLCWSKKFPLTVFDKLAAPKVSKNYQETLRGATKLEAHLEPFAQFKKRAKHRLRSVKSCRL